MKARRRRKRVTLAEQVRTLKARNKQLERQVSEAQERVLRIWQDHFEIAFVVRTLQDGLPANPLFNAQVERIGTELAETINGARSDRFAPPLAVMKALLLLAAAEGRESSLNHLQFVTAAGHRYEEVEALLADASKTPARTIFNPDAQA